MASPIFVRGLSRSGGTLLVTILDAHPDIAMSYELYPNLLLSETGEQIDLQQLLDTLSQSRNMKAASKKIEDRNLQIFLNRCPRGGLDNKDVAELLQKHIEEGQNFLNFEGQMRFIERCCLAKMQATGKSCWGLKCLNQFEDYAALFPKAYFLNIIRDGRDVLASQLNTGSFKNTPKQVGEAWSNTHLRFRSLVQKSIIKGYEVFYEKLAQEPEEEIQNICDFLDISFDQSMLNFYEKDLDIYKTNHLSMNRISKPIDTAKIGRWKKELNEEHLKEFYSTAKAAMSVFGYSEGKC